MTSKAQIEALRHFISQQRSKALFACGGAIPIGHSRSKTQCAPVVIRFASSNPAISSITLPSEDPNALVQLLYDSQPTTFGHGDRDVYDETYRKASKMDVWAFCTNFSPHDLGIMDTVGQLLHPSLHADTEFGYRGVRAELYKLNIYSGPSGMFKAHVDTPKDSPDHFGSLVVCLPCVHEGGQLVVQSDNMSVKYDWSSNSKSAPLLQWAAFYADCLHEVQPVLSGHRVTLTYNLYDTKGTGLLYAADFQPSPLSSFSKTLVDNPGFLPNGGTLGLYSTHSYSHSRAETISCLPCILKGVDMAMYQIFTILNLKVQLRPIYCGRGSAVLNRRYRRFAGKTPVAVGSRLHEVGAAGNEQIEKGDSHTELAVYRPNDVRTSIVWLNSPSHSEFDMAYATRRNEAKIGTEYSSLALLIPIPPFSALTQTRAPATLWQDRLKSPSLGPKSDEECDDDEGDDTDDYDMGFLG